MVIDILMHSDLVHLVLTRVADKEYPFNVLQVKDKDLLSNNNRNTVVNLPLKLPMICPPKPYAPGVLGGYCLNDVKFAEELLIEKHAYAFKSVFSGPQLYSLVNNISKTPFKINQSLLDYITIEGDPHGLLIDPEAEHKYEFAMRIDPQHRLNKTQRGILASHRSKIVLQETILGLAEFYRRFSCIYFPVQLDQRGRLYCSPAYLNYQGSELAKALLLFAEPGVITKGRMDSIIYLKAYGVNCYGGIASKASIQRKSDWVDKNIENSFHYDNGILLGKAKDKFAFLAFCMEYKRFYDFYTDENQTEFHTYLPVQLDATCNGFQHMALLSNEGTLFEELNLVTPRSIVTDKTLRNKEVSVDTPASSTEVTPGDFYNFLLHKLVSLFQSKVASGVLEDERPKRKPKRVNDKNAKPVKDKGKGSYERLLNFI